ncbi:MAG TPA: DUF4350 domain-containing protein [Flavobacteriaceae bacterium]|nr:DUF4350 domain-containing protein [Flavobacteriaceae bacterium]
MSKYHKILLTVFLLLLAGLVFLEASQPQPINWNPSYAHVDKIPLGSYVFYESMQKKYPENFQKVKQPPFEFLNDSSVSGTYLFLNHAIAFGEAELKKILAWAAKGNTVYISAAYLGQNLLDTLQLETRVAFKYNTVKYQPILNFTNPNLKADSAYFYAHDTDLVYFLEIDTTAQTVLGISDLLAKKPVIEDSLVNFIKAPFGKGEIFLHLFPEAFSNYFMLLGNNREYAEKALAYIDPEKPIFWDAHYKIGGVFQTSPLYILLGNKYLKWAYYFVLIAAVLFVLFEGKRKQKSIEIVPPLQNKTHDFTRTIAGMYLENNDHKAIAEKQIQLFLNYVRTKLRINTQEIDEEFLKNLSERSGNSEKTTRDLFSYIASIQQKQHLEKSELLKLNKSISDFKEEE